MTTNTLTQAQIDAIIEREQKRINYRKEYNKRPERVEARQKYMKEYNERPEVKEARKEKNKERRELIKKLLAQHREGEQQG